jgi:hypothetical protein
LSYRHETHKECPLDAVPHPKRKSPAGFGKTK